jgi:hypothetical protein
MTLFSFYKINYSFIFYWQFFFFFKGTKFCLFHIQNFVLQIRVMRLGIGWRQIHVRNKCGSDTGETSSPESPTSMN